ncbi:hypothetical protein AGMMS50296_8580 [Alphaproteobacteria bacterium]|nr:hypothetical protein AGMMS50296_8580 [Alphaproteobacteria bacterium]
MAKINLWNRALSHAALNLGAVFEALQSEGALPSPDVNAEKIQSYVLALQNLALPLTEISGWAKGLNIILKETTERHACVTRALLAPESPLDKIQPAAVQLRATLSAQEIEQAPMFYPSLRSASLAFSQTLADFGAQFSKLTVGTFSVTPALSLHFSIPIHGPIFKHVSNGKEVALLFKTFQKTLSGQTCSDSNVSALTHALRSLPTGFSSFMGHVTQGLQRLKDLQQLQNMEEKNADIRRRVFDADRTPHFEKLFKPVYDVHGIPVVAGTPEGTIVEVDPASMLGRSHRAHQKSEEMALLMFGYIPGEEKEEKEKKDGE